MCVKSIKILGTGRKSYQLVNHMLWVFRRACRREWLRLEACLFVPFVIMSTANYKGIHKCGRYSSSVFRPFYLSILHMIFTTNRGKYRAYSLWRLGRREPAGGSKLNKTGRRNLWDKLPWKRKSGSLLFREKESLFPWHTTTIPPTCCAEGHMFRHYQVQYNMQTTLHIFQAGANHKNEFKSSCW